MDAYRRMRKQAGSPINEGNVYPRYIGDMPKPLNEYEKLAKTGRKLVTFYFWAIVMASVIAAGIGLLILAAFIMLIILGLSAA